MIIGRYFLPIKNISLTMQIYESKYKHVHFLTVFFVGDWEILRFEVENNGILIVKWMWRGWEGRIST